jgi:hypothetical protein
MPATFTEFKNLYQKYKFGNIKKVDRDQVFPASKISAGLPWENTKPKEEKPTLTMAQKLLQLQEQQNANQKKEVKVSNQPAREQSKLKPVKPETRIETPPKEDLWSKIINPSEKLFIKPRGLVNDGNMCFMNVILQPLVHCSLFHNLLNNLEDHKDLIVLSSLKEFLSEFQHDMDRDGNGKSFLIELNLQYNLTMFMMQLKRDPNWIY